MTKGYNSHVGTPYTSRKARESDGHRTNEAPPAPKPKPDSQAFETAEQASLRRQRVGGKD